MRASFITISLLATVAIAAPAPQAGAKVCKYFQIFRSGKGGDGFRGPQVCCCTNHQCHPVDFDDGVDASADLNNFLGGSWNVRNARNGQIGKGSLDVNGYTYTVASGVGC